MVFTRIALFIALITLLPSTSYAGWLWKSKKPVIIYDIEKSVFDSLTEEQRKHVIEVYNGHEATKEKYKSQVNELKKQVEELEKQKQYITTLQKEKEGLQLETNKLKVQIESQAKALNNFLMVSEDLLEAKSKGKNYREKHKREKYFPKITSIHRGFNSTTVKLENETVIEVSPFEKEKIDSWMTGQTVELTKGEGMVYVLQLTNLDTENSVSAKIKEAP